MTLEEFAARGDLDPVRTDWGALLFGDMGYCEAIQGAGETIRWWSDVEHKFDPATTDRAPDQEAPSLVALAAKIDEIQGEPS